MVAETEMAEAVMRIAAAQSNGVASYSRLRREIPRHVRLTAGDLAMSSVRKGEPMWHQIFRNIKSHFTSPGNAIHEGWLEHVPKTGYRITPAGRARL
jgi:hypothetical protein